MGLLPEDETIAADYISAGLRCGLSMTETLQCPVGLLLDLWEVWQQSHGLRKKGQLPV